MTVKHTQVSEGTADLTAAALTHDLTAGKYPLRITAVKMKASVNITETVTVTHRDSDGNQIFTEDTSSLSAAQNYVFEPTGVLIIEPKQTLRIACTNANTTGTVYSKIMYEEAV